MINKNKKWITSKDSRMYGNFLRAKFDAVITGINTVMEDNPLLNCRHSNMENLSPVRFILDSKLRIKENFKIVKTAKNIKTYVFTNTNDKKKILKLKQYGVTIKCLDQNQERINLKKILFKIGEMGFVNVLLEAGPNLNIAFLKYNLINKIYYFKSNEIIKSKTILSEKMLNIKNIESLGFKLSSSRIIGNDTLRIYEK